MRLGSRILLALLEHEIHDDAADDEQRARERESPEALVEEDECQVGANTTSSMVMRFAVSGFARVMPREKHTFARPEHTMPPAAMSPTHAASPAEAVECRAVRATRRSRS